MTLNREGRQWWRVLLAVCILAASASMAKAQNEGPPPPPQASPNSVTVATPAATTPPTAQIAAMLGGAEFMLILDRPYAAEQLFKAVLSMDPKNGHALDGLHRAQRAKRVSWTFLAHGYAIQYDTQLSTWGGGPSFYTPYGKATFWVGDGFFRSDGFNLRKVTINGIWDGYYKNFDYYAYLNRTFYPDAPDRTLWNLKGTWNRKPGREYYSIFSGQHDSYLQTDLAQFFAPESYPQVEEKILNRNVGGEAQIAVGKHIDLIPYFSEFFYTDGNQRRVAQGQVMYRVLPHGQSQMPIFRIGASYQADSCNFGVQIYYCPVNFESASVNADFVYVTGKYRYGVFASIPFTGTSGTGLGRYDPTETLYSFVNYKVSESQEVWLKFTGVHSPSYSPKLWDLVVGTTVRF